MAAVQFALARRVSVNFRYAIAENWTHRSATQVKQQAEFYGQSNREANYQRFYEAVTRIWFLGQTLRRVPLN